MFVRGLIKKYYTSPADFRLPPYEAGLFLAYQLLQPIGNLLAITITCMITINEVIILHYSYERHYQYDTLLLIYSVWES